MARDENHKTQKHVGSNKIPDSVKEQWIYLRTQKKMSLREIAEATNSNVNTIAAHLCKKGIRQKRRELIEGRHAEWIDLRLQGYTVPEIAKIYHCGRNTLYKFFQKNGIVFQRHKRREKEPEPDTNSLVYINGYWLKPDEAFRYMAIHTARKELGEYTGLQGGHTWQTVKDTIKRLGLWDEELWGEP